MLLHLLQRVDFAEHMIVVSRISGGIKPGAGECLAGVLRCCGGDGGGRDVRGLNGVRPRMGWAVYIPFFAV